MTMAKISMKKLQVDVIGLLAKCRQINQFIIAAIDVFISYVLVKAVGRLRALETTLF